MITMHLPQKDDQTIITQKHHSIIIDLNITGRRS